jgi:Secretion system C-terminal sorting domain
MKNQLVILAISGFVIVSKTSLAQYGGYIAGTATDYLGAGSAQGVFADITYNDGSITSASTASVYFVGSSANVQHQILSNLGGAVSTQIGNVILSNGTGGLFINNTTTGLEIVTNLNFNAQNSQITTVRNATAVANNNLHIDANATISGYNAANNINGYLKKDGDAAGFTFPLADGSNYAPMTVGALGAGNSVTAAYYKAKGNTAAAYEGGPFPVTSFAFPLLSVSRLEYWDVTNTGTPSAALSLTFQGDYSAATVSTLFIVGWRISSGLWELIPSASATGLTPGNTISSTGNVNFSNYSAFTLAAITPALPVNLISFNAYRANKIRQVLLSWVTTDESNLDNYIVERSANGSNGWEQIGKLSATNSPISSTYNFQDNAPLNGNNYYHLKILNTDGAITFSAIRLVIFNNSGFSINLYPNPATGLINISINASINKRYTIILADETGRILQQQINAGTSTHYKFDISHYATGMYYINLFDQNNRLIEIKKFIKQ